MLTQKLVRDRRPDVYIPGQATHILRYWYLVPLIKPPPWAAGLLREIRRNRRFLTGVGQFERNFR